MNLKIPYRPDIDGLRAIAIILVIIYHAGFSFLPGGFIGVDVFFVLSGFLITSLIDYEIKEQKFSFKTFYLRRIRRIIPVLVFVMLVVTIPASFILFSNNLEAYSRTLIHTMISTNNFHLYVNSGDYFSENSDLIPFLHTWSLSIEEQFYFIFPLLLLFLHKKLSLNVRLLFLILLFVFGLLFSIYQTNVNPRMAYFLLPARLFELLMGACLAVSWSKLPELSNFKNHSLSIIGLILILVPASFLNKSSLFPGLNAFLPCLGTTLLIFSGKNEQKRGVVNMLIQNKLFVFVGLISYSLYLWHWPVFVLIKYLGIDFSTTIKLSAIVLIFILSFLSWKYVEQPFRVQYIFNFRKTILIILAPSLLTIAIIYGVIDAKDGFPDRFQKLSEFNPKKNYPNVVRKQCFDKFKLGNCDECYLGIKKDTLDGLLIGDSFANHTAAFLDVLAKDAGLYIHDTAAGGYPLMNRLNEDGTPLFSEKYAVDRINYAKKFKNIFIAANWESLSEQKNKMTYLNTIETLRNLLKDGKKIIIFDALRATTEMNLHRAKLVKSGIPVSFDERNFSFKKYQRPKDYIIYKIKKLFPSILIIDLNEIICEGNNCNIQLNNTIVYRNSDHLNTSGAMLLGKEYLSKKNNPLKALNKTK